MVSGGPEDSPDSWEPGPLGPHGFEGEKGPLPASSPIPTSEEEKSGFREA